MEEYDEKEKGEEDAFDASISWFKQSLSFDAFSLAWIAHVTISPWSVAQRQSLMESIQFTGECCPSIEDILIAAFCYCTHGLQQNVLEGAFHTDPYFFRHKTIDSVHFSFCFRKSSKDEDTAEIAIYSHLYLDKLYDIADAIVEQDFRQARVIAVERDKLLSSSSSSFRVVPKIHFWEIPLKTFLRRYLEKLKLEECAVFRPR